jgi:hypothetical protein
MTRPSPGWNSHNAIELIIDSRDQDTTPRPPSADSLRRREAELKRIHALGLQPDKISPPVDLIIEG